MWQIAGLLAERQPGEPPRAAEAALLPEGGLQVRICPGSECLRPGV